MAFASRYEPSSLQYKWYAEHMDRTILSCSRRPWKGNIKAELSELVPSLTAVRRRVQARKSEYMHLYG